MKQFRLGLSFRFDNMLDDGRFALNAPGDVVKAVTAYEREYFDRQIEHRTLGLQRVYDASGRSISCRARGFHDAAQKAR
jgi:hypothetical protein